MRAKRRSDKDLTDNLLCRILKETAPHNWYRVFQLKTTRRSPLADLSKAPAVNASSQTTADTLKVIADFKEPERVGPLGSSYAF